LDLRRDTRLRDERGAAVGVLVLSGPVPINCGAMPARPAWSRADVTLGFGRGLLVPAYRRPCAPTARQRISVSLAS